MKFIVENAFRNASQIAGIEPYDPLITDNFVGDSIEACSAEEAIDLAIDYLMEQSDLMCERTPDGIKCYSDGEVVLEYYGFKAKKISETKSEVVRLRITPELKASLQKLAASEHRTVSNYLESLIKQELAFRTSTYKEDN